MIIEGECSLDHIKKYNIYNNNVLRISDLQFQGESIFEIIDAMDDARNS